METISKQAKAERIRKSIFKNLPLKLLLVTSLFIVSLVVVVLIIHEAVYENEQGFDNKVFSFFSRYTSPKLIDAMKFLTFFGSSTFLIPAYSIIIIHFLAQKKYRYSLHIAITAISSTLFMFALKDITHRTRPNLPIIQGITNYSFPSGHTLSAFIFFGMFVYVVWHQQWNIFLKWFYSILLFAFAVSIGISRIILRVHYPTDVVAAFCFGNIWVLLSLWAMRKLSKNNNNRSLPPPDQVKALPHSST